MQVRHCFRQNSHFCTQYDHYKPLIFDISLYCIKEFRRIVGWLAWVWYGPHPLNMPVIECLVIDISLEVRIDSSVKERLDQLSHGAVLHIDHVQTTLLPDLVQHNPFRLDELVSINPRLDIRSDLGGVSYSQIN